MTGGRRVTLRIFAACNNHCIFCPQDGVSVPAVSPAEIETEIARARASADEVTLTGGEPTLHPDLPSVVAAARALGFRRVGLQTNARRLADLDYAAALATAGLTDVHVSIHGTQPASHDYHTGAARSLVQTMAGVAAARVHGLTVVATTVLTRSNFRLVGELPRALATRGIAAWLIAVPHAAGRAAAAFERVVPRLALALPFALHALETARAIGLPAWIQGAPLCLLGPHTTRALDGEQRAYGPACEGCGARAACPGVDAMYLARFRGDELAPRPAVATARDTERPALARMFVGAGPLAVRPDVARGEPRRRLPVLPVG